MKISGFAILLLLFSFQIRAQQAFIDTAAIDTPRYIGPATQLPPHPRILLLAGEEKQLLQNIHRDKTWQAVQARILQQCDSLLSLPPLERVLTGIRLLPVSRACLFRVFHLAYAWRMTHEKKYFDRAEEELLAVSAFSDWHASHYLDVAEMTTAVAIGYDWLYNDLSPVSRALIRQAIRDKGIATSYDTAYHVYRKWLSVTNNWNQVCNTGMLYGSLAIYEEAPELAIKTINRSIASIRIAMKDYDPDGAFAEGYTYWGYGTTFNILFLSTLEKAFKSDFGLRQFAGFFKTADYLQQMIGPSGDCFNYSDATARSSLQPGMFWFASVLKRPSLLSHESLFLTDPTRLRNVSDRLLPALLVWGSAIPLSQIPAPTLRFWTGGGKNPVAFMRSSWIDTGALFVGFKGGSPSVTHGHMDVGSFVMESDGQRWAMDFGAQDYSPLEEKNVDLWANEQGGQRWEIYRYNNFTHNTLTIDGRLQRVSAYARIDGSFKMGSSSEHSGMFALSDISSAYAGSVKKAVRGIELFENRAVRIRDEVTATDTAVLVRWSMVTSAAAKVDDNNTIELSKNGKHLYLIAAGNVPLTMKIGSTVPPHSYDEPNPGTLIVGFEARVAASAKAAFTVCLVPGSINETERKKIAGSPCAPLAAWK